MLNEKFLRKLRSKIRLVPPFPKVAGSMKEFRDWDIYLEAKYPKRFALQQKLESAYRRCLLFPAWRMRDLKWAILHRYHPNHRYNVIKTSLEPGYYDVTERMLFALGDDFASFYERILAGESHSVWDYSDMKPDPQHGMTQEHIDARQAIWLTMGEIYAWWKARPTREDAFPEMPEIPEEWGMMAMFNDDFRDTPEIKAWREVADKHHEMEKEWKAKDQEMLHKIIDIREYLWD